MTKEKLLEDIRRECVAVNPSIIENHTSGCDMDSSHGHIPHHRFCDSRELTLQDILLAIGKKESEDDNDGLYGLAMNTNGDMAIFTTIEGVAVRKNKEIHHYNLTLPLESQSIETLTFIRDLLV